MGGRRVRAETNFQKLHVGRLHEESKIRLELDGVMQLGNWFCFEFVHFEEVYLMKFFIFEEIKNFAKILISKSCLNMKLNF